MDEYTWKNMFQNELDDQGVPRVWSFCMEENLQPQQGYLQYTQCTFARFQCSRCSRWWNSAQVHILFLIRWDKHSRRGTVRMRIYRQECKRCNFAVLEKAEITEENSKRVISNLVSKIQSMVYRKNSGNVILPPVVYSDDIEGPHDKEHCEACKEKVCRWKAVDTDIRGHVIKPQSAQLQIGQRLRVQENYQDFPWPTSYAPSYAPSIRPSTAAHQTQNVEIGVVILIIFIICFLALGFPKK
ncbi:receptor-transporting protein 3-like [Mixophyes fleayi]|uniref:receptor-transporting protein 3-like n=1 Tax=Mixophyes fleayi TaxID=3061075 RepID=UPI003F4DE69B